MNNTNKLKVISGKTTLHSFGWLGPFRRFFYKKAYNSTIFSSRTSWTANTFTPSTPFLLASYFCNMEIQIISPNTPAYEQMIDLRMDVLLDPIGIPRSYINPEKESQDILIAAFENDQIIGCCILTPSTNNSIQLRQMAVKQNIQRSGIGASIVAFAETKAKELGYQLLFMNARDVVIPFYEKQGYEIDGEGFTEVNIPHHKMKKEL